MTQQEIQERNKDIALMLGLHHDEECVIYGMTAYTWDMLRFHSDWRWLMDAVEFIKNLDLSEFNYHVGKMTLFRVHKNVIEKMSITSKKEAVFIAVSDFAKLYNNKQL